MFVVEWAKEDTTLLKVKDMLQQAFHNAGRYISLVATRQSRLELICTAPTWIVSSLVLVARTNINVLRKLGVVKLTIGLVVILDDLEVRTSVTLTLNSKFMKCGHWRA